jgi:hypothetical protein
VNREILEMLFEQGALNFKNRMETYDQEIKRVSNDIILALSKTILNIGGITAGVNENLIQELFMRIYYNEITVAEAVQSFHPDKKLN